MPVPAAVADWYESFVVMSTRPRSTDRAIFAASALVGEEVDPSDGVAAAGW